MNEVTQTLRHGQFRIWHPDHEFLYAVWLPGNRMGWASIAQFTADQVRARRPLPQTRKDHPSRKGSCSRIGDKESDRAEPRST